MNPRSDPRDDAPELRQKVREQYGKIASSKGCCSSAPSTGGACCGSGSSCCTGSAEDPSPAGYSAQELAELPSGADLGLGCGNPTALLALGPDETVLDLGSGAGVDCFLAAKRIGPNGRAIGVDMTPEMLMKARENARKGGFANVEFRLGEIEHLPVADGSVDVVISNCVINLAPDKGAVYREAFRVLRPGGRLAISDVLATRTIPDEQRADPSLWSSCIAGTLPPRRVRELLKRAGFREIRIDPAVPGGRGAGSAPRSDGFVRAATIRAVKPPR
jgi:arsenite methyltransferase